MENKYRNYKHKNKKKENKEKKKTKVSDIDLREKRIIYLDGEIGIYIQLIKLLKI